MVTHTTRENSVWKRRIPISLYTSAEHFERERDLIFRRAWLNVCRESDVPKPKSYLTVELPLLGVNLVVARAEDGRLRAFHNTCSHRGAPICPAGSGSTAGFVCPFHGWTYGLDGSCRNVPDAAGYGPLDLRELALKSVAIDSWAGFVFVNLDPSPATTLREYLGPLGERLAEYPFDDLGRAHYRYEIELAANWKTIRDSFVESHHTRHIHRKTLKPLFVTNENPFSHGLGHSAVGLHGYFSLAGNPAFRPTLIEATAARRGIPRRVMAPQDPPGVNFSGATGWMMDVNVIFPNFFIDPFKNSYLTYHFWPLAVGRTLWEIDLYFPSPVTASERFYHEVSLVRARDALLEDIKVIEDIYARFTSGARSELVLHDEEFLIAHGHAAAAEMMGAYDVSFR